MPTKLLAERDALLKALELAHRQIHDAQKAQKHAEQRIQILEAELQAHETQLECMHRQFEKRAGEIAACNGHGDDHIQSLEHKIGQSISENQRLKSLLIEAESAQHVDHEYIPAPKRGTHHEPDPRHTHLDIDIEIQSSPPPDRRHRS